MKKSFTLLCIGNSFSDDMTCRMYEIANAEGFDLVVENLYIGGCSIERHYNNITKDTDKYELRRLNPETKDFDDTIYISTIQEAVAKRNWDYISLQQASTASGHKETYELLDPLLEEVKKYVQDLNHTKFIWHMTWAYQEGFELLNLYENSQKYMYDGIVSCLKDIIVPRTVFTKIIPDGFALQHARETKIGDNWTRDGFHLDLERGRFLASLNAICTLLDISPRDIKYNPSYVSEEEREIINNSLELAKLDIEKLYK